MKVLQINCVYGKGSTGLITQSIHKMLLERGSESVVLYGRGKRIADPFVYKTCSEIQGKIAHVISRITGIMYGGCTFSTSMLIKRIEQEKPDIVHLQCINGYFVNIYKLVRYLNTQKICTVLTLHAEFMYTANCGHALSCEKWKTGCGLCPNYHLATESIFFDRTSKSVQMMKEAFESFENLTVVCPSAWIMHRAKESLVLKNAPMKLIYNGINTNIFSPQRGPYYKNLLAYANGRRIILFVTSVFDRLKGADIFFDLVRSTDKNRYAFIVVGSEQTKNAPQHVKFEGKISNRNTLAQYYTAADVTILCSRQDNYPTVCLESAACGTPVVGFDVGGVAETIKNGMGIVVPAEDIRSMRTAIESLCSLPSDYWDQRAKELHEQLSERRMGKEYIDLYEKVK